MLCYLGEQWTVKMGRAFVLFGFALGELWSAICVKCELWMVNIWVKTKKEYLNRLIEGAVRDKIESKKLILSVLIDA